jgi:small-conductance mechanosensitive channel
VINRAVIDEMSKQFLVSGRDELQALEQQIEELEVDLETTHADIIHSIQQPPSVRGGLSAMRALKINKELDKRHDKSKGLQKAIRSFCERIADKHKPAQKLYNATIHAMRRKLLDQLVSDLAITRSIPAIPRDRQITMEGQMARLKVDFIVLNNRFSLLQALKSADLETTLITWINVP